MSLTNKNKIIKLIYKIYKNKMRNKSNNNQNSKKLNLFKK